MAGLFSFRTASFEGSTQPQSLELWTGVLARWGSSSVLLSATIDDACSARSEQWQPL
jgi:hypothetical protein